MFWSVTLVLILGALSGCLADANAAKAIEPHPSAAAAQEKETVVAFTFDGKMVQQVCTLQCARIPTSSSKPRFTTQSPDDAQPTKIIATITWVATSALTEEVRGRVFRIEGPSVRPIIEVVAKSPIKLETALDLASDVQFGVDVFEKSNGAVPLRGSPLPQEFKVVGEITYRANATA